MEKVNGILTSRTWLLHSRNFLAWMIQRCKERYRVTLSYRAPETYIVMSLLKCVFFVEFRTLYKRVFTFHAVITCVNEVNYSGHIRRTGRADAGKQVYYCFCVFGLSVSIGKELYDVLNIYEVKHGLFIKYYKNCCICCSCSVYLHIYYIYKVPWKYVHWFFEYWDKKKATKLKINK